jgi:hypothetical protein
MILPVLIKSIFVGNLRFFYPFIGQLLFHVSAQKKRTADIDSAHMK